MGATVGGYELVQRLAVGGMAEVFLARRPGPEGFEKRVAVKRILPHLAKQTDFVAMFLDEARLAAKLDHPHIVHIYDFGVDADAYYLAMEYVCGEDLAAIARRAAELGQPLDPIEVALILLAACEALDHAHAQGIVHRDVTPANLLVSYDGVVKLADFGIAKSQAAVSRVQTNAGTLKGKIPYMSPEQARAQPIDRRSDVFSLGIVGWELLTGKRLFQRRTELDMLRAVQMCDVPAIAAVRPTVPAALGVAIETALAASPDDRFASAAELGRALAGWLASTGEVASRARLADTMTRLFGADGAARRMRAFDAPAETTAAGLALPQEQSAVDRRPSTVGGAVPAMRPLRNVIPQIAMHLHLPPPRMPPLRLVGPALALLISAGGLLFGLRSPHAHHAPPTLTAPAVTTPSLVPRVLFLHDPPPHIRLPAPALRPPPVLPQALAPRPEGPRQTSPRRHERQRRARPGRGMIFPRRQAWPTSSAWRSTSSGSPS